MAVKNQFRVVFTNDRLGVHEVVADSGKEAAAMTVKKILAANPNRKAPLEFKTIHRGAVKGSVEQLARYDELALCQNFRTGHVSYVICKGFRAALADRGLIR